MLGFGSLPIRRFKLKVGAVCLLFEVHNIVIDTLIESDWTNKQSVPTEHHFVDDKVNQTMMAPIGHGPPDPS